MFGSTKTFLVPQRQLHPKGLFAGLQFELSPSIKSHKAIDLSSLLTKNGAIKASSYIPQNCIFILPTLEGEEYQNLKRNEARVMTIQCVEETIKNNTPLPLWFTEAPTAPRHTVMTSRCMDKVVVCCTGIDTPEREQIHFEVHAMGGDYSRDFHANITHVVATESGSDKYKAALKMNYPAVCPNWIHHSFNNGRLMDINAGGYKVNLLAGKVISPSNMRADQRERARAIVQQLGGTFSPDFGRKCTHLVSPSPEGKKYEHAQLWGVTCVHPNWLFDMMEHGVYPEEVLYPVPTIAPLGSSADSDPNNGSGGASRALAVITTDGVCSVDTNNTNTNTTTNTNTITNNNNNNNNMNGDVPAASEPLNDNDNAAPDFEFTYDDDYHGVIPPVDNSVTLAAVPPPPKTSSSPPRRSLSTSAIQEPADPIAPPMVKRYTSDSVYSSGSMKIEDSDDVDIEQGASKKRKVQPHAQPPSSYVFPTPDSITLPTPPPASLQSSSSAFASTSTHAATPNPNAFKTKSHRNQNNHGKLVFSGLKFCCFKYKRSDCKKITEYIREHGAEVVSNTYSLSLSQASQMPVDMKARKVSVPLSNFVGVDFVLARHGSAPAPPSDDDGDDDRHGRLPQVVTASWVDACIMEERLVDVAASPLYQPLPHANIHEMKDFVVCVTGFEDYDDRQDINTIITVLGAKLSEELRKDVTHLICKQPAGPKFDVASQWGNVAILRYDWLVECAQEGVAVDVQPYLWTRMTSSTSSRPSTTRSKNSNDNSRDAFMTKKSPSNESTTRLLAKYRSDFENRGVLSIQRGGSTKLALTTTTTSSSSSATSRRGRHELDTLKGAVNKLAHKTTEDRQVLAGVNIFVHTSLAGKDDELHTLCSELGGEYSWVFDDSKVTHFIHEGKPERNQDYVKAASHPQIKIVSPAWLVQCKAQHMYLPEDEFPTVRNSHMALSMKDNPPSRRSTLVSHHKDTTSTKEAKTNSTSTSRGTSNGGGKKMLTTSSTNTPTHTNKTETSTSRRRGGRHNNFGFPDDDDAFPGRSRAITVVDDGYPNTASKSSLLSSSSSGGKRTRHRPPSPSPLHFPSSSSMNDGDGDDNNGADYRDKKDSMDKDREYDRDRRKRQRDSSPTSRRDVYNDDSHATPIDNDNSNNDDLALVPTNTTAAAEVDEPEVQQEEEQVDDVLPPRSTSPPLPAVLNEETALSRSLRVLNATIKNRSNNEDGNAPPAMHTANTNTNNSNSTIINSNSNGNSNSNDMMDEDDADPRGVLPMFTMLSASAVSLKKSTANGGKTARPKASNKDAGAGAASTTAESADDDKAAVNRSALEGGHDVSMFGLDDSVIYGARPAASTSSNNTSPIINSDSNGLPFVPMVMDDDHEPLGSEMSQQVVTYFDPMEKTRREKLLRSATNNANVLTSALSDKDDAHNELRGLFKNSAKGKGAGLTSAIQKHVPRFRTSPTTIPDPATPAPPLLARMPPILPTASIPTAPSASSSSSSSSVPQQQQPPVKPSPSKAKLSMSKQQQAPPPPQKLQQQPAAAPPAVEPSTRPYGIMLTGFIEEDKDNFVDIIEKLGGSLHSQFMPGLTTHAVALNPTKSEKFLCACAAGIPVLQQTFLIESKKAGRFVPEGPHEWTSSESGEVQRLINACKYSRAEVAKKVAHAKPGAHVGMFSSWHVLFWKDKEGNDQSQTIRRILRSGAADIIECDLPFTPEVISRATHVYNHNNKDVVPGWHNEASKLQLAKANLQSLMNQLQGPVSRSGSTLSGGDAPAPAPVAPARPHSSSAARKTSSTAAAHPQKKR
eukprot:TRINITY_DN3225_c0_g2_i2.p1 TRINITY_DN3225_c0_g2~~TRINITY_DN3225_c0_g2_i2.p1  ORF type:complete len:1792 (+),score=426.29 TRINITY_DN3225_c0_g2_i2:1635-7010(+)